MPTTGLFAQRTHLPANTRLRGAAERQDGIEGAVYVIFYGAVGPTATARST